MALRILVTEMGGVDAGRDADSVAGAPHRVTGDAVAHVGDAQGITADQVQPDPGGGLKQLAIDNRSSLEPRIARRTDAVETHADQTEIRVAPSEIEEPR